MTASCRTKGKHVLTCKPRLDDGIVQPFDKPAFKLLPQRPEAAASITTRCDIHWQSAIAAAYPSDGLPLDLVCLNAGVTPREEEIQAECVAHVRTEIAVSMADGTVRKTPVTIDNPANIKATENGSP